MIECSNVSPIEPICQDTLLTGGQCVLLVPSSWPYNCCRRSRHMESGAAPGGDVDAPGDLNTTNQAIQATLATQATQITSIDGFFNRKRGRPPKNRFVEVYKSAQHSPQAIFTSFKLERNEHSSAPGTGPGPGPGPAPASSASSASSAPLSDSGERTEQVATATDLTPSRSRKRSRVWATYPAAETNKRSAFQGARTALSPKEASPQPTPHSTDTASSKNISGRNPERVSVVRAAGTFYPENACTAHQPEVADRIDRQKRGSSSSPQATDLEVDQPEDLSMRMRPSQPEATAGGAAPALGDQPAGSGSGLNLNLLQFKQLIDLYQRQVLLPSFLAAASQPMPALDMRLLLESAAQQKLMLINAAAASAAAAVAATAGAEHPTLGMSSPATTTVTVTPRPPTKRARDHDIPSGYLKFRFNEDCGFDRCGYRNHQSHFHCNRRDCHYSFCDKTRFVQHTARHDRMDTLMGDDFQQFRANMRCGVASCCYASGCPEETPASRQRRESPGAGGAALKKTSHFHCRKCDYVCTDSNKVVAHRRLHLRLDYVRSAGFRKVTSNESCNSPACSYALRHTHYHCVTCNCSVLSRAQLASHKHRPAGSGSGSALPKSEGASGPDPETHP
ncbi:uncharacterized protein [Drosophila pseudoobscura]|uniref:Uncharacterized protein isoform X1 n=1 Tax=Drosophila pseudoobscura pseudoobscura TaxID=46245 RepID=A0A6I8VKL1_DROPS|nr:uncharacterized protein LOC6900757 isoform X1 [Drosophila pseudoobscura]